MKQCFHEDPHQRPKFDEVRTSLTKITSELRKAPTDPYEKNNANSNIQVLYSDLAMKEQYMLMRRQHKTLKSIHHSIVEDEERHKVQTMSFEKSIGESTNCIDHLRGTEHLSYASLLNTTASPFNDSTSTNEGISQESPDLTPKDQQGHIKHENRCRKYMTYTFGYISKENIVKKPLLSSISLNPIYNLDSYSKDSHHASENGLAKNDIAARPRSP